MIFIDKSDLVSVADKIRELLKISNQFTYPLGFIEGIKNIQQENFESERGVIIGMNNPNTLEYFNNLLYSDQITFISCPNISDITNYSFAYLTNLQEINLRDLSIIPNQAFINMSLKKIDFANCYSIGMSAFKNCYYLSKAFLPKVQYINMDAFEACVNLRQISLPNCQTIVTEAFQGCLYLTSVYLYTSSVVNFTENAFVGTPIISNSYGFYGSIYLPKSLYNDYKLTSVWSSLSERMVFI